MLRSPDSKHISKYTQTQLLKLAALQGSISMFDFMKFNVWNQVVLQ